MAYEAERARLAELERERGRLRRRGWIVSGVICAVGAGLLATAVVTGNWAYGRPALVGGMCGVLTLFLSRDGNVEAQPFEEIARARGLSYTANGTVPPLTPLLASGQERTFAHTIEGPLLGSRGGPRCLIGHLTTETRGTGKRRHTLCAVDLGPADRVRVTAARERLRHHPLVPAIEYDAGVLVVAVEGHEDVRGRIEMLHDLACALSHEVAAGHPAEVRA